MTTDPRSMCKPALGPDVLRRLEPIRSLSARRQNELFAMCRSEKVARGLDPFHLHGVQGQSVYLLSGELNLVFDDGSTSVIVGGSESSEPSEHMKHTESHLWPLIKRPVREARAITDIELIRVDDLTLDIMMTWDQLLATPDGDPQFTDWRSMSGAFRVQSLTDGPLSRLPAASIDELFRRFERIEAGVGEVILSQGDIGDFYYIIESGRCLVARSVGGVDMALAELKAGDAFGEEALVAESRRNATVRMKTAGALLRLAKNDFIELMREPLLKRLPAAEAQRRVQAGALWLDVRYPPEFQKDRLPGAVNVPLGEIRNALGVLDREREYIVYCQSGRRSSAAAFLLSQRGYCASCLDQGLQGGTLAERPAQSSA